ncbi:Canalicular multispecific organic anion transporter 1 [Homalodisca vitripennis]|nr:Canalicular multispecific organic anion transporter 1 [Homalodisca vitripennis]
MDVILVMKEGEIVEKGTFKELLDKKGEFSEFLIQHLAETEQRELIPEIEELIDEEVIQTIQRRMSKSESMKSIPSTISNGNSLRNLSTTRETKEETQLDVDSTQSQSGYGDATLHKLEEVEEMMSYQRKEIEVVENGKTNGSIVTDLDQNRKYSETEALLKKIQEPEGEIEGIHSFSATDRKCDIQSEEKKTKLIQTETAETGRVKRGVYLHYCKCMGVWLVVGTFSLSLLSQAAAILANIWLSRWTSDKSATVNGTQVLDKRNFYLEMYFTFGFVQVVTVVASTFMLAFATVLGAGHLHESILSNILRCPMSFFDTTPMGRIVNRLSKDIDVVDNMLPNNLRMAQNAFATYMIYVILLDCGFNKCNKNPVHNHKDYNHSNNLNRNVRGWGRTIVLSGSQLRCEMVGLLYEQSIKSAGYIAKGLRV